MAKVTTNLICGVRDINILTKAIQFSYCASDLWFGTYADDSMVYLR